MLLQFQVALYTESTVFRSYFNLLSFYNTRVKIEMTEVYSQPFEVPSLSIKKVKANAVRIESAQSGQGISAALKILEPARKKLATVETQRIIECLDECIRRQELVAALLLILLVNEERLEQFSIGLGSELMTALKLHKVVCDALDNAIEEKKNDKTISSLQLQVSESCKNIQRLHQNNPGIITSIRSELSGAYAHKGGPALGEALRMIEGLYELRGLMFERLLTTPAEETDRARYLKQVTEREKNNAVQIEKLQAQLDAAIEDKEEEMSKKNEVIRRLKNDLHQIEQFSEEHIRRTKNDADKQQASDTRGSDGKQSKLKSELEQLTDQLSRMIQEHRDTEQHLRKKKFKIETEVENWINKYDQDIGEKQDEYEQIDKVYTDEKKQLSELEEKFAVLDEEYSKIMEERRIAREEKEARELELQHMMKAAITIQAFFRAYKVRKALKSKAKGKGKGKGKGKKKK